jgi:hypothetical protein
MIMKRKLIFFVTLLIMVSFITLQSCEFTGPEYAEHFSFTEPAVVAPLDGVFLHNAGATVNLQWTSKNESGDPVLANVYFGTSEKPPLYKANHNALILTVPVEKDKTYYWHVTMKDANGITTTSPTWSFTIFEPFMGLYTCDEPAESYSYEVTFVKTSSTVITTDNYWNSGWNATFTLDLTAKTYSMPLTSWLGGSYSAIESGTIDAATGTIVGNYTIYHPAGVSIETGVHTYTKPH